MTPTSGPISRQSTLTPLNTGARPVLTVVKGNGQRSDSSGLSPEQRSQLQRLWGRREQAAQVLRQVLHDDVAGPVGLIMIEVRELAAHANACSCEVCHALPHAAERASGAYQQLRRTLNDVIAGHAPKPRVDEFELFTRMLYSLKVHIHQEAQPLLRRLQVGALRELRLAVQELVLNAHKHSQPTRILMSCGAPSPGELRVTIHYDGTLAPEAAVGNGTKNVRDRLDAIAASMRSHQTGKVATLVLQFPFEAPRLAS